MIDLEIVHEAQRGNKRAVQQVVEYHLKHIRSWVRRWCWADPRDLIAAGVEGLLRGLPKYKSNLNNDFWKYIQFWVRAYVRMEAKRTNHNFCEVEVTLSSGDHEGVDDQESMVEHCIGEDDPRFQEYEQHQDIQEMHKKINMVGGRVGFIMQQRLRGYSQEDIGKELGVTRQWIQQLEEKGIKKLKKQYAY